MLVPHWCLACVSDNQPSAARQSNACHELRFTAKLSRGKEITQEKRKKQHYAVSSAVILSSTGSAMPKKVMTRLVFRSLAARMKENRVSMQHVFTAEDEMMVDLVPQARTPFKCIGAKVL